MSDNAMTRFIGGSPIAVLFRLLIVSLLVGAFMVWQGIRPEDVIYGVERAFVRLWEAGFDSVREIGQYIFAGAVVVIPVWLIMRLMASRRT